MMIHNTFNSAILSQFLVMPIIILSGLVGLFCVLRSSSGKVFFFTLGCACFFQIVTLLWTGRITGPTEDDASPVAGPCSDNELASIRQIVSNNATNLRQQSLAIAKTRRQVSKLWDIVEEHAKVLYDHEGRFLVQGKRLQKVEIVLAAIVLCFIVGCLKSLFF